MIECLTEMCSLRGMDDFASVIRLAEHISVTWESALCRGVLHNLLQPPGVEPDEELPDWAPTARKFVQQLHLPLSRTQVRTISAATLALSFICDLRDLILVLFREHLLGFMDGSRHAMIERPLIILPVVLQAVCRRHV